MDNIRGVLVIGITTGSKASDFLQTNDVILSFNGKQINRLQDLLEAKRSAIGTNTEIVVFRNQKYLKQKIDLDNKK